MSFNSDVLKIYVKKDMVVPLRSIALAFGVVFTIGLFMALVTGEITGKFGGKSSVEDEPALYFANLFFDFLICAALYFVGFYAIRENRDD